MLTGRHAGWQSGLPGRFQLTRLTPSSVRAHPTQARIPALGLCEVWLSLAALNQWTDSHVYLWAR